MFFWQRNCYWNQVLLQDYIWKCSRRYLGWTWKQCALTVSYVIFPFVSSTALFSFRKKWLNYLSHAISPYLHGKLINWTSAFYSSFWLLNIIIFMNRFISIIYICQWYFMLFHMQFYIAWYLYQIWQPADILFN